MLNRIQPFHSLARWAGLIALLVLTIPASAAGLNDTGITTCSNNSQNGLPCPVAGFPGQDAEFGNNKFDFTKLDAAGNALPATATDHTCVRDNVTGLIWQVKLSSSTYTFDQAAGYVTSVNSTGLCGFDDWRMPNPKELTGIANHGRTYPAIDTNYFPNTPNQRFWSGLIYGSSDAWDVGFYYGSSYYFSRSDTYRVRLVRGEQSFNSFFDNNNGTVTQSNTGLMWAKCSEGQSGTNCTGTTNIMNWSAALNTANNSNLGGYNDWRLPNLKELQALVDYSRYNPAINTSYFPNTPSSWFWSSSPYANDSLYTWSVDFKDSHDDGYNRDYYNHVRLVRGGQFFDYFQLTVNKSGSGAGAVTSSDGKINCGSICATTLNGSITLSSTADGNSVFTGWTGSGCSGTGSCTVNMNAAQTVTANFAPASYSLSISKSGNGLVYSDDYKINCGSTCSTNFNSGITVNLHATADTGYMFSNWSNGCTGSGACSILMNSAKAVLATFNYAPTYTIALIANPSVGGSISCSVNPVIQGGSTNCTAAPNAGYNFTGFSGDCSGTNCSLTNVTSNKNVTANFTALGYPINATANPSLGGSVNCSVNPVNYGGSSNCVATANAGYTFTGFSGDCSGTNCSLTNVTANKTVTANFTAITYPINATANPSLGGSVNCSANPVAYGGSSNCTATPNIGYSFTGFSGDCSGTSCSLTNITATKTVTANFTAIGYPINATANPSLGGSVNCSVNPVAYGGSSNCAATANAGYTFTGFSGDCSGTNCSLTNVTANKTVTANFTALIPTFGLAVTNIGNGTVTSNDGQINCGATCAANFNSGTPVTLTATPASGATFVSWSGCTPLATNALQCQVSMNKAQTVTATFAVIPMTYPLTISAVSNGIVTSNPVGITCGAMCTADFNSAATVTLTAVLTADSTTVSWIGCTPLAANPLQCQVNMTAAKMVTATFIAQPPLYSLAVIKVGNGTVTSAPLGINCGTDCAAGFDSGTPATLTAIPARGVTSISWSGCTPLATNPRQCQVTLTNNTTVTTTFNADSIADVRVMAIAITPKQPTAKSAFTATITIKNLGTIDADGGTLSVWTNQKTAVACGAIGNKSVAIGTVAAGTSKVLTLTNLAVTTTGDKLLRVFVDSQCKTKEANETNNQTAKRYSVK